MTLHAISRYMDQPTQKMIETLIKRKRKYEGFAKQEQKGGNGQPFII